MIDLPCIGNGDVIIKSLETTRKFIHGPQLGAPPRFQHEESPPLSWLTAALSTKYSSRPGSARNIHRAVNYPLP